MKTLACTLALSLCVAGCAGNRPHPVPGGAAAPQAPHAEKPAPVTENFVFITGNVGNKLIPFTPGMTLSQAYGMANYLGGNMPRQIAVTRGAQSLLLIETRDLFRGQDMLLEAGDRIEIRP